MVVLAKMATFWPWPSIVININKKKIRVKFFGDLREGVVDKSQCVPFSECSFIVFNYVRSIEKNKRKEMIELLENKLDETTRKQFIKNKTIRHLYLQAIKDVEIHSGAKHPSILNIMK